MCEYYHFGPLMQVCERCWQTLSRNKIGIVHASSGSIKRTFDSFSHKRTDPKEIFYPINHFQQRANQIEKVVKSLVSAFKWRSQ